MTESDFIADEPIMIAKNGSPSSHDWLMTGFLLYFGVVALVIMTFLIVAWTNA